jgi:hypothetical protein
MNKLKQKYLYSGIFITIISLGFCILGEKVFALYPSGNQTNATSTTFLIEIPHESNCNITDTFTNTYTEEPLSYDIILVAPEDIQIPTIIDEDNFFKINGRDVSVPDGNGGRKIPKGEIVSIPSDTEIKYEILDNYCRDGEISFSLDEKFVDLKTPFECFINCQ